MNKNFGSVTEQFNKFMRKNKSRVKQEGGSTARSVRHDADFLQAYFSDLNSQKSLSKSQYSLHQSDYDFEREISEFEDTTPILSMMQSFGKKRVHNLLGESVFSDYDASPNNRTAYISGLKDADEMDQIMKSTLKLVRDRRKIKDFADIVVSHLDHKTKKLVNQRRDLKIYHDDKFYEEDQQGERSIGSISSADENDCELMTCGAYQHKFEVYKKISKVIWAHHKKHEKIQKERQTWRKLFPCIYGRNRKKMIDDEQNLAKIVEKRMLSQVHEFKESKITHSSATMKSSIINPKLYFEKSGKEVSDDNMSQESSHLNLNISMMMHEEDQKPSQSKLIRFLNSLRIDMSYKKHLCFAYLVTAVFYIDFFITCRVMGNYQYIQGQLSEFLSSNDWYYWIIIIQGIDILFNFFRITFEGQSTVPIDHPPLIMKKYFKGHFLLDFITALPWHKLNRSYLFLRILKIKRLDYRQSYIDQLLQNCVNMNGVKFKTLMQILRLIIYFVFLTHIFACLWILLGQREYYQLKKGWIYLNEQGKTLENEEIELYIIAFYYTIQSFSQIGYGDFTADTKDEHLFGLLIIFAAIALYGYMLGTFTNIITQLNNNPDQEREENVNIWLVEVDKARKNVLLSKPIFDSVREFFIQKHKLSLVEVFQDEFYQKLKPQLQLKLQNVIFRNYLKQFEYIFIGTNIEFQNDIMKNCEVRQYQLVDEQDNQHLPFIKDIELPVIEENGTISKFVHFINKGQIFIMDKNGLYEYGNLKAGSYFGDISILLDQPEEFSYFYNPQGEQSVILFSVKASKFLEIIEKHPLSKEIFVNQAEKRQQMFNQYRQIQLIKFMKYFIKNPLSVNQLAYRNKKHSLVNRLKLLQEEKVKMRLIHHLLIDFKIIKHLHNKTKGSHTKNTTYNISENEDENDQDSQSKSFSPQVFSDFIQKGQRRLSIKKGNSRTSFDFGSDKYDEKPALKLKKIKTAEMSQEEKTIQLGGTGHKEKVSFSKSPQGLIKSLSLKSMKISDVESLKTIPEQQMEEQRQSSFRPTAVINKNIMRQATFGEAQQQFADDNSFIEDDEDVQFESKQNISEAQSQDIKLNKLNGLSIPKIESRNIITASVSISQKEDSGVEKSSLGEGPMLRFNSNQGQKELLFQSQITPEQEFSPSANTDTYEPPLFFHFQDLKHRIEMDTFITKNKIEQRRLNMHEGETNFIANHGERFGQSLNNRLNRQIKKKPTKKVSFKKALKSDNKEEEEKVAAKISSDDSEKDVDTYRKLVATNDPGTHDSSFEAEGGGVLLARILSGAHNYNNNQITKRKSREQIMKQYKNLPPLKMTKALKLFQKAAKTMNPMTVKFLMEMSQRRKRGGWNQQENNEGDDSIDSDIEEMKQLTKRQKVALTKKRRQLVQSKEGLTHQLKLNLIQLQKKKRLQYIDSRFVDKNDYQAMSVADLQELKFQNIEQMNYAINEYLNIKRKEFNVLQKKNQFMLRLGLMNGSKVTKPQPTSTQQKHVDLVIDEYLQLEKIAFIYFKNMQNNLLSFEERKENAKKCKSIEFMLSEDFRIHLNNTEKYTSNFKDLSEEIGGFCQHEVNFINRFGKRIDKKIRDVQAKQNQSTSKNDKKLPLIDKFKCLSKERQDQLLSTLLDQINLKYGGFDAFLLKQTSN